MANEPYCRQYDYGEKLLSKMIRTEIALESLTREMKAIESTFESKIRQVTEMGSDLETKLRQVTEDLVSKVQSLSSRPVRSEGIVYLYVLFYALNQNISQYFIFQVSEYPCNITHGIYLKNINAFSASKHDVLRRSQHCS